MLDDRPVHVPSKEPNRRKADSGSSSATRKGSDTHPMQPNLMISHLLVWGLPVLIVALLPLPLPLDLGVQLLVRYVHQRCPGPGSDGRGNSGFGVILKLQFIHSLNNIPPTKTHLFAGEDCWESARSLEENFLLQLGGDIFFSGGGSSVRCGRFI